jgi:pilus assembly protein CpaF
LAAEMPAETRVVVAEEVLETHVPLPNVAHLQTRPARPERPAIDLRRLVAGFLRMAPDLAIVGEVRDHEGSPMRYIRRWKVAWAVFSSPRRVNRIEFQGSR